MNSAVPFCVSHGPGRPRWSFSLRALLILAVASAFVFLPLALSAQGKGNTKTGPSQPTLEPVVTDQMAFNLSPNFGDWAAYDINQARDFVFIGVSQALFLRHATDASPRRLLQVSEEAPGFRGSRVDIFGSPFINSSAQVVFWVDFAGTPPVAQRAIYLYDGGAFRRIAYSLDTAPGTGGKPFGRGLGVIGMNDAGVIALLAPLVPLNQGMPAQNTIYLATAGGTPVRVVGYGDSAPGTNGGTFDRISGISLNAASEVLFSAAVVGGNGGFGLFAASLNGVRKVVSNGDPRPTIGGTFSFPGGPPSRFFNNSGQVAFAAGGIFLATPGIGISLVAKNSDAVPALSGGTLNGGYSLRAFNTAGQIAFKANIAGVANTNQGLFRYVPGTGLELAAYQSESAPGTSGSTFGDFPAASLNASGLLTFFSDLNGPIPRGFFQQSPGGSPSDIVLEGASAPLLGGGKLGLALWNASRTLNDGSVFFESDVLDGEAYIGTFLYSAGSLVSLVNSADPLPPGANVSLRTFAIGAGGGVMCFWAALSGGQGSLWAFDTAKNTYSRIIADGEEAPGVVGRLVNTTVDITIVNSRGDIGFIARLVGGPGYPGNAIFLRTASGTIEKIVAQGDVDPATGGMFADIAWNDLAPFAFNNSGQVVFRATLMEPAGNPSGIFVGGIGSLPRKVVLTGEVSPADPAGTFYSFTNATINNAGMVAFHANTQIGTGNPPNLKEGLFTAYPGGAPAKVVAAGDAGPGGSTFPATIPPYFTFNDLTQVGFITPLVGGPGGGVFIGTGIGSPMAVALSGDSAPSGGNFSFTSGQPNLHLNNSGDLVFRADLTGGTANSGAFLVRRADGILRTVLLQGQDAPGMKGTFFTLLGSLNNVPGETLWLTPGGDVICAEQVAIGDGFLLGHFRFDKQDRLTKIFARGDQAPKSGGGTIGLSILQMPVTLDSAGRLYAYFVVENGKFGGSIYRIY